MGHHRIEVRVPNQFPTKYTNLSDSKAVLQIFAVGFNFFMTTTFCFCSLIDPHMITSFSHSLRCKASGCEGKNLKEEIRKLEIRRLE